MKTLKDLNWSSMMTSAEGASKSYSERSLKEMVKEWVEGFENGKYHTDFAADHRRGQENIVEWIEYVFNMEKEK